MSVKSLFGSSDDWKEKEIDSSDPVYPYAKFLLDNTGFNKLVFGAYNLEIFAEIARPICEIINVKLNQVEIEKYAKELKNILVECSWIADQNYALELYTHKDDKISLIHIDRNVFN